MAINQEILNDHFLRFFPSLSNYPKLYQRLFFVEPGLTINDHIAYVCPLCTKNGIIAMKDGRTAVRGEFTKDHYPPENVGGKRFLLICEKCNNDSGGKFEKELINLMDIQSYNKKIPGSTLQVKAKISAIAGNYNSEISVGQDGRFEIAFKPNEKSKVLPLDNWIKESKTDNNWSAEITVKDPDEQKVSRALLKAAYLFCFDRWQYEFVYSETAALMRTVIHENKIYPVRNPTFWLTDIVAQDLQSGVYILKVPAKWKSFMVIIKLSNISTGHSDMVGVLIPGPSESDWHRLKEIQQELLDSESLTLSFELFN